MTTPADIERWLSLLPPSKQGDVKVRQHTEVGSLYHMSTDQALGVMIPSVTRRTLSTEDRAVPRISVAPTLAGCILAYQACDYDFTADEYTGWYVYSLPYEHAVRPNKRLLPDVEMSDEHWLVTFDPDTVAYHPRVAAKFFITDIQQARRLRLRLTTYRGYLEVRSPEGFVVAKDKRLPMGKYEFSWTSNQLKSHSDADAFVIKPVTSADYKTARRETVSLLAFDDQRPGSAYW